MFIAANYYTFRPHRNATCFHTGMLIGGSFSGVNTSSCPSGPPSGQSWFSLAVTLDGGVATAYLNNQLLTTFNVHFTAGGKIGFVLANGYENIVRVKNIYVTGVQEKD